LLGPGCGLVVELTRKFGKETHNNDGRHHHQSCDAVFLYCFQHLDEIEFLHDIDGNTMCQTASNEDRLRHRMVEREKAKPFPTYLSVSNSLQDAKEVYQLTKSSSSGHDLDASSTYARAEPHSPHTQNA
jgi:hypothetical protein